MTPQLQLTREGLDAISLETLRSFVGDSEWLYKAPGQEHHKLLAYLSSLINDKMIFDIGTHLGDSAHALAYNITNHVHSFDILDKVAPSRRQRANITYHLEDLFDPMVLKKWGETLLESAIVFIDIDPHAGKQEMALVEWLRTHDYQGLIVLDDIWYFKAMRDELWQRIEDRYKLDVTRWGHWSGTGLVSFAQTLACEGTFRAADTSNWTLVTGYFDLTQRPDATVALRARPANYYLDQHGAGTLMLEQNLIVFCDKNLVEKVWELRPKRLHARTRVVPMSFDDFPMTKHYDRIVANRGGQGACPTDPRNTASYYLFCVARFAMLKKAIEVNAFESTHFAWINVCIERYGYQNLAHLQEAFAQQRDGFSTCYIDYVDENITKNLEAYFGTRCQGRCTMCSGFFTGGREAMREVCDRLEGQFLRCLDQGYGHADEQLINLVYFEAPHLFDWYIGDYMEMITNYARVYANPEAPLRNVIRHSYESGAWKVCARACDLLWQSHEAGTCKLSDEALADLNRKRRIATARGVDGVLDLDQLFNKHASDKQTENGYAPIYHAVLKHLREEPITLLEIGIGTVIQGAYCSMYGHDLPGYRPGASLRAWRDYFPKALIYGIDIQPDTMITDEPRIQTALCDTTDPAAVKAFSARQPAGFDVIVDDGAHIPELQLKTLRNFFPVLRSNGIYVIEDVNRNDPNQTRLLVDHKGDFDAIVGDALYFTVSMPKADVIVISKRA